MVHSFTISTIKITFVSIKYWISGQSIRDHNEVGGFVDLEHKYRSTTNSFTILKPSYGIAGSGEEKGGSVRNTP